jgi:hypothetical protein
VIEVQLVRRTADDTLASISSPDGQLYGRRYNPALTRMGRRKSTKVFLCLDRNVLELERFPLAIVLCQESTRLKTRLYDHSGMPPLMNPSAQRPTLRIGVGE